MANEARAERLLSIKELSLETGLTVKYIRKAIKVYGLPAHDLDKVRVRLSEYNAWLSERPFVPKSSRNAG